MTALAACSTAVPRNNPGPPAAASGNIAGFLDWLRANGEEDARYVLDRFSTNSRYQMTGHAWSAFHGIGAFLRANPDLAAPLARGRYAPRLFWEEQSELRRRFAAFVATEGHRFPGQDGGNWAAKLPRSLGGSQTEGGAGSGLVARMLILMARYQRERESR